jgi:AcrR family transcriptional regulator
MATRLPDTDADEATRQLLEAARQLLERDGPGALTVRAIAAQAGTSTMAVYSRFGGKDAVLQALYAHGFDILRRHLDGVPEAGSGRDAIVELARAYRRFALENPGLYRFMFETPLPGFDPSLQRRWESLQETFAVLVDAVTRFIDEALAGEGDANVVSLLVWCTAHGHLSLELTNSPLPGWIVEGPEAGESIFLQGVRSVLDGLAAGKSPA